MIPPTGRAFWENWNYKVKQTWGEFFTIPAETSTSPRKSVPYLVDCSRVGNALFLPSLRASLTVSPSGELCAGSLSGLLFKSREGQNKKLRGAEAKTKPTAFLNPIWYSKVFRECSCSQAHGALPASNPWDIVLSQRAKGSLCVFLMWAWTLLELNKKLEAELGFKLRSFWFPCLWSPCLVLD